MKSILNMSISGLFLASGLVMAGEQSAVESPTTVSPYKAWNEKKRNLKEDHGLELGMDYNMLGLSAPNALGEDSTAAGALRVYGQWDLFESDSGSTGGIVFKFEHRHKYTDSSPKEFGLTELGYVGFVHSLYGVQGFRATHLFWRQSLLEERMVIYAGFLDMTDYTDFYALANPWTDFNNAVFSSGSGTIGGLPDGALGVMVGGFLSDTIYGSTSVIDAKGNASDLIEGAKDLFDSGATWKSLELGWTPNKDMLFITNAHISLWQRDAVGDDDEGYGVNLSLSGLVAEQWLPFVRAGWADGGGAMYDASFSFGFGYMPTQRSDDMFGIAFNWASPMSSTLLNLNLEDQYTAEIYYRAQITPWLQVSPSLQALNYTAIDIANSKLIQDKTDVVFGLKARFAF